MMDFISFLGIALLIFIFFAWLEYSFYKTYQREKVERNKRYTLGEFRKFVTSKEYEDALLNKWTVPSKPSEE